MAYIVCVTIQVTHRPYRINFCDGARLKNLVYEQATASLVGATETMPNQCRNDPKFDGFRPRLKTKVVYVSPTPCTYSCGRYASEDKAEQLLIHE